MSPTYADHGSEEFNARMHDVSQRIGTDVEKGAG